MAEGVAKPQMAGWIRRAATLVATIALSACAVVPKAPPPPIERPPVARPEPRPLPPVIQPGIPQDTERHRVALLVPLSGTNAGVGQSLANATQLALLDLNNDKIRITSYDTNLGAANAAQRAVADGNRLILGPLLADDVRAAAPIARDAGVPIISFSNDASVAGGGAYLMGYSPAQSIERVVDYARERGIADFAGLMPVSPYGQRASTVFLRAVEGAGGQVRILESYGRTPASMTAAAAKLKAASFDAVLLSDASAGAATVAAAIRRNGSTARLLGTEQWNLDTSAGARPALSGAWFASVSDNLYPRYLASYRARFGGSPYRLSSLGYDAVLLTVRIARDWRVGAPFPADRLDDRGGFAGVDGAFRFGRDGIAERALEVQEIRGGTMVTVSPAPNGFGR